MNEVTPRYFCINELTGTGPFEGHTPIVAVSRQCIHNWVRSGRWPKPLKMNRTIRWTVSQVREALARLEEAQ
jgi:predicted DNA-binding transcriptional regulator AlpA